MFRVFFLRTIGFLLITTGLSLIIYVGAQALAKDEVILSPVPEDTGIRVTFTN